MTRYLYPSAMCCALAIVTYMRGPLDWSVLALAAVLLPIIGPALDWLADRALALLRVVSPRVLK